VSKVVLDASALLSLLNAEPGADLVQESLSIAVISAVNVSEVVSRLYLLGMPENEVREALSVLALEVIPFDGQHAFQAGFLSLQTRSQGLSLGDRACLALAAITQAGVLTADRVWQDLDIGVDVKLIR